MAKREGHDVAASDAALSGELGPPSGDSLANPLTQAGTLLGTPRYMSPEQHRLAEATARSDQFSFCVALYEGLYRAPAFAGKSARGYGMNVQLGRLEAPPRGASVPAWLRRVLVRGLAPAPEERWPSMDALLAALSRDAGRRWRTLGVALGLAALVAGVSYTVAERRASQALAEAQVCTGAAARLVGTWDVARGEAIARAFRATELSYAEDAAARVQQGLDARAEAWVSMHTETCKRHHQGELSSNQLELQMACLEDRRGELAAIVEVLSAANDQVVEQSVDAVAKLRPLRRCADAEYLQAAVKPPDDPETAAAVDELRARAMKLKVAVDTGDFAAGRDGAAALLEEARALGYRPLIAEALFLYGFACTQAGDHAGSIEPLREAFWTAVGRDANVTAAMAAGNLAFVHGASLLQFDEGRMWARHAEAFIERVGGDPELTASLANSRGALAMRANEYEEAERQFLTAIRVHEGAHGQRGPTLGRYHANLAGVYGAQYEWEKSEQHSRRAHELFARELGPSHPLVAHPLNTLGNALKEQGRYEEALALMRRSVEIYERAVGPEHPTLATFLNNLGTAQLRLKDYDAARETFARALAVREQALGPEHPQVATIVSNFAHIALETQQFAEAREHYSRALEILTGAFGEDSPFLALIYSGLGRAALGLGDVDEAIAKLERALELANDASRKTVLSEARFGLARALLTKSRKHRARALELARQARQDLERYDEGYSEEIAEIDAWLAARAKE
ncbi:MAG: tetratricopeptide repeat protein [Myxococcales bacterium]|nr:tetratricopeptide repeat protein [Myxococcales bacterium]